MSKVIQDFRCSLCLDDLLHTQAPSPDLGHLKAIKPYQFAPMLLGRLFSHHLISQIDPTGFCEGKPGLWEHCVMSVL